MSKIDPSSAEKFPNTVDLFNSKPHLVAYSNTANLEYLPNNSLGNGPIHFTINSGLNYVDLSNIFINSKFRIIKNEGEKISPINSKDHVSFIQGFGGSFLKNVKVSFNGHQVYNSNDLYAYNAYLRRRLGLGVSQHRGFLQAGGYYEDGNNQMEGPGFEARRVLYEGVGAFETSTTIDADIFRQKKLLLNQVVIDIELTPQTNVFTLLSHGKAEYQYQLLECKVYAKQHTLLPQLDLSIQQSLNRGNLAKYPFTRSVMKNFFINPDRYDFSTNLYNDYLPKRVFACLVDAKAFNGHIGMSPFEFSNFNLENIQLCCNGSFVPTYPYKLDWKKNQYIRAFTDMAKATDWKNDIDLQEFANHSCIFAFDLQTEHSKEYVELQQIGSTTISMKFKDQTPKNGLQLIVLGEFNTILAIDSSRNITSALSI